MTKTILLLLGIGALFAASTACFGPSSKPIKGSSGTESSDSTSASKKSR